MRKILFILSFLLMLLPSGCIYDDLPPEGDGTAEDTPFTLSFTVGVPAMDSGASTRAIYYGNPLYYEDWIDTQDGLRVLFFISKREKTGSSYVAGEYGDEDTRVASDPKNPLKDYFLFESTSRWVTQLPYDDNNNLRYRITVPVYQIGDEESEYKESWPRIRDLLREYNFKVAILANHKSPDNTSKFSWSFQNSLLAATNIDDLSGEKNIKTINDIHHAVEDVNYATSTNANRKDGFDMLVDKTNNTMGPYIDWVTARSELYGDALGGTFNTQATARTWIRDYWIPDLIYNEDSDPDIEYETLYHNYRYIWSYWNFGGAAADNALPYSDKSKINKHLGDWEVRNGKLLREWVTDAYDKNGGVLTELSTASNTRGKYDGSMPLTFHPSAARAVITESNGKRLYGVKLPALSADPSSTSAKDCFHYRINAPGTVTVRYSGSDKAVFIKGNGTSNGTQISKKTVNGVQVYEYQVTYTTVTSTLDGYVFCKSNEAILYDIEYTQDEYIYGSDREGILPSSDHPIPMYGVQKYDKLQGYWEEGASFDLTDGNNTNYKVKTISLLRAVAKIEVLIPKSLGVPKHIYMRSFNRRVRCEPMDLATPTEKLWKDHANGCEWKMVQNHSIMMSTGGTYSKDDYKKKLAWFYGNWLEWGWNFNNMTNVAPKDSDKGNDGFPRLFNPYVNRADRAAFIDVTDYYNDQYYHYLFYMGENTLDAPSDYSGAGSSPTVPHVEIRFDERYAATSKVKPNSDLNLNDNDCYRIYFTDGGLAAGARNADGTSKIPYDKYIDQYEKQYEYVKEHWPVLRNHVYSFTVLDNGSDRMNGLVVDVQNRSADFDFK